MKGNFIKFGSDKSHIPAFKPYGNKFKEGKIPKLISRNYIDSLSIGDFSPFNAPERWNRYSPMNQGNTKILKTNLSQFSTSALPHKLDKDDLFKKKKFSKMMKSDLLSSHFSLGSNKNLNPSEKQANFNK